jgi:hypothetical protein
MDAEGYIRVDKGHRTSLKGDLCGRRYHGGIKQIITAVGQGGVAAITIFEDIAIPIGKKSSRPEYSEDWCHKKRRSEKSDAEVVTARLIVEVIDK